MLGRGWCANGDFLTPAIYRERRISPTQGPTITTAIDFLDGSDNGQRYFVEDGGFPDVVGNALRNMLSSNNITTKIYRQFTRLLERTLAHRDPLACIMPWFGQGVDVSNGTMTLKGSELDLAWESGPSEPVIQALIDRHKAYSAVTGGTVVESPMWSLFKFLVTPHPLGGCNMGTTSKDGVVDHTGEVFNYPRLYVMDSAVVPRALGLNPSRTIAALAERNSALIE